MKLFDAIPPRTLLPNAITATAMMFGLASAYLSVRGQDLQLAAWFVLLSVLLDKLDGSVARLIRGSSAFGIQFDSFADSIAFGVAPAALVFASSQALAPEVWGPDALALGGVPASGLLAGLCLGYAVMTSVRLARFNVTTETIGPSLFLGLPSTLSGALLCASFLAVFETGLDHRWPQVFALLPALLLLNALLMVSNLPLPKFKVSRHKGMRALQIAAAVTIYVLVPLRIGFSVVLLVLLGYIVLGFAVYGPRMLRGLTPSAGSTRA